MNISNMLLELIYNFYEESFPSDVIKIAKDCIIDYLCVSYSGSTSINEDDIVKFLESDDKYASIIGKKRKTSILNAALINGMSAHYMELDDGNRFGMIHLGAPILSALFAVAQTHKVSGKDFIRGIVIGYEIAIRLSSAIQPAHKKRGYHATGTCGCIGAAIAVATMLKFDHDKIANTLAAAVASSAGLLEMIDDESQLKIFNVGKAAQNAIIASSIGNAGYMGPNDSIGGKRGLLGTMGESIDLNWFNREGAMKYTIKGIYRKLYSSCRHCHPSVESVLLLSKERELSFKDIKRIAVETYGLAVYGHDHTDIKGIASAKMSIPYAVASALVLQSAGIECMTEGMVKNKDILELTKKVYVEENMSYTKQAPKKRIAKVTVFLNDNISYSKEVTFPKGEPENPVSDEELLQKFMSLMDYAGIESDYSKIILDTIENIESRFNELLNII